MDPRPVDFAYRRQRPNNLTYQSYGLSESLMHVGAYSKKYQLPNYSKYTDLRDRELPNPENIQNSYNSKWRVKNSEINGSYIYPSESQYKSSFNQNTARQIGHDRMSKSLVFNEPNNSPSQRNSKRSQLLNEKDSLTKWTSSLTSKRHLQGQDRVYEYQQKPYDILNLQPKMQPNGHRIYPRYSLQHKIVGKPAGIP